MKPQILEDPKIIALRERIANLQSRALIKDFFDVNEEEITGGEEDVILLYGPWCVMAGQSIDL